jgi:hypothetical protein
MGALEKNLQDYFVRAVTTGYSFRGMMQQQEFPLSDLNTNI